MILLQMIVKRYRYPRIHGIRGHFECVEINIWTNYTKRFIQRLEPGYADTVGHLFIPIQSKSICYMYRKNVRGSDFVSRSVDGELVSRMNTRQSLV